MIKVNTFPKFPSLSKAHEENLIWHYDNPPKDDGKTYGLPEELAISYKLFDFLGLKECSRAGLTPFGKLCAEDILSKRKTL